MTSGNTTAFVSRAFPPTMFQQPIIVLQTRESRAVNVGYIEKHGASLSFVPARLHLGNKRAEDTFAAAVQSLELAEVKSIIQKYAPPLISTITILRETLACNLGKALWTAGVREHYGDAFIGVTHATRQDITKSEYLYENIEGLSSDGLWILADSVCTGRNTGSTMSLLLAKSRPKEILILAPAASRVGINAVSEVTSKYNILTTFVTWGALFGVSETKSTCDMPWGHKDTEPLDYRDQKLMVQIYGPNVCSAGDSGNNYFCPQVAKKVYEGQLTKHGVTPKIPSGEDVMQIYKEDEIKIVEA